MKNRLDMLLRQIWPGVRERHFYPELPAPQIAGGDERVALELKGKKITLSSAFIDSMAHRLDPRLMIGGLLDHAMSHYLYCPWDFTTHLQLYKEARSVVEDKTMAKKAADLFMDVVADTYCISHAETSLPDLYRRLPRSTLDEAICALYQKIWDMDLGAAQFTTLATRLSRIPYLDRRRWPDSIRRFAVAIQDLLEEEDAQGQAQPSNKMGDHAWSQYSPQEIEDGLKKLASAAATPVEFKSILKEIQKELTKAMGHSSSGRMGLGRGDPFDADRLFYMKLSQDYALPIRKRPTEKSGSLYPHHHVPWESGKPLQDIDPWKSFGKIMPGLSKSWQRVEGEMFGRKIGTPDAILVIDSSGSMTDPRQKTSYAILGAACAAESYLRNGSRVAVYNFSDAGAGDEHVLPPTRDRSQIYGALCRYYGGGTCVSVSTLRSLQTTQRPDIILFTDMRVNNLENLMAYLSRCKNHITAVLIGKNEQTRRVREKMASRGHVCIHSVRHLKDIPKIVLGALKDRAPGNKAGHCAV